MPAHKTTLSFNSYLIAGIIALFSVAIILQMNMYTHWDNLCILEEARRFIHGGTYQHDFFETNPPMIIYLYAIPVWLSQKIPLQAASWLDIETFLIAAYAIAMCQYFIVKVTATTRISRVFFIASLSFAFVIFPSYTFAEREHIMIMLVFPYLLLTTLRLQNYLPSRTCAWVIGILAGIGFCIKPHFLLTFVLVELYLMWRQKTWRTGMRIESLSIIIITVLYLASIFLVTPEYLTIILPFVKHFYLTSRLASWYDLMLNYNVALLFIMSTFLHFFYNKEPSELKNVLWLAAFGFFLAYLIQAKGWDYQILPTITILIVYLCLVIAPGFQHITQQSIISTIIMVLLIILAINPSITRTVIVTRCKHNNSCILNQFINYVKTQAHGKPIYFFSNLLIATSASTYGGSLLATRYATLWMIPSIQEQAKFEDERHFLRASMVEDFKRFQPYLVFVDITTPTANSDKPFDYIAFFSQNPQFKKIWQHYRYVEKFRNFIIFKSTKTTI